MPERVGAGAMDPACACRYVFAPPSGTLSMTWLRFIPETTNIDFVGWRYYAFAVDGLLVLISIISIAIQGFNLGIDFTGGTLIEAKAAHTIDIGALRSQIGRASCRERV